MATKIVLSDLAPSDAKRFALGMFTVEVPTETDDPRLVAEARNHPWLDVEVDETASAPVDTAITHVDPTKDPLSAEFKGEVRNQGVPESTKIDPLAVEAGLDQNKAVTDESGELAVTLAATDADDSSTKTPKKKGS